MTSYQGTVGIWWDLKGRDFEYGGDASVLEIRQRVLAACEVVRDVFHRLIPMSTRETAFKVSITPAEAGVVVPADIHAVLGAVMQEIALTRGDYNAVYEWVVDRFHGLNVPDPTEGDPGATVVRFGFEELTSGQPDPYYWIDDEGNVHCVYDLGLTVNDESARLRTVEPAYDGAIDVYFSVDFVPIPADA